MQELKPCPFCGGEARGIVAKQEDGKESYSVTCMKCNTAIFRPKILEWDSFQSLEEAIGAWNRRVETSRTVTAE